MATAESQHAYPHSLSRESAIFFARHLGAAVQDIDALLSRFTFSPMDPAALRCTPDGHVLRYDPDMRTVHDELCDALRQSAAARAALTPEERLARLAAMLRLEEIGTCPEPRMFAEGICGHYQYRCLVWRPQDYHWNSGVLLRDMRQGDKPLPTVIGLWPEGVKRLCEHSAWIHRCVRSGYQVLVMDVAGSGALLPAQLGNTSMYEGWSTMYNLDAYLMQLDDSLFALRTRQIVGAIRMVQGWPESDGCTTLCAEKEFSRYADLAALLSGTPVSSDEDFQTFGEIVSERYHDQTWSHAWVLPGALQVFDAPEIKTLLEQQGLSVRNPGCTAHK